MKVKLDENLPDSVIPILQRAGHEVDTVRAEGLRGATDPAVLEGATADGRLLITLDRGLGDVRTYPPGTHAGVLVLRLDHQSPEATRLAIALVVDEIDLESLAGEVGIWRRGDLRVRRAQSNPRPDS